MKNKSVYITFVLSLCIKTLLLKVYSYKSPVQL